MLYEQMKATFPCVKLLDGSYLAIDKGSGYENFRFITRAQLLHNFDRMLLPNGGSFVQTWINDPSVPMYQGFYNHPTECPEGLYNLYRPPRFEVDRAPFEVDTRLITMIRTICGEGADDFFEWLRIVATPGKRAGYVPVLVGPPHSGKSTLVEMVKELVGGKLVDVMEDDYDAEFIINATILHFNDIYVNDLALHTMMSLVTNELVMCHRDGMSAIALPPPMFTIATTNVLPYTVDIQRRLRPIQCEMRVNPEELYRAGRDRNALATLWHSLRDFSPQLGINLMFCIYRLLVWKHRVLTRFYAPRAPGGLIWLSEYVEEIPFASV